MKKKIQWCSWAKLFESKDCGGMGFRDLYLFSQAMLAKQNCNWWKAMWSLRIPSENYVFYLESLPPPGYLRWSTLLIGEFQLMCSALFARRGRDTTMHALWNYPGVKRLRSAYYYPKEGTYKIITDVAIQECNHQVRVGIIVRNSYGHVMGSSTQKIAACFSPHIAEATAILRGLRFDVNIGIFPDVLESDAK
ncbi:hypothetical protein Dsin_027018 [Dipteronia sinensis]|uniref:RNase H type-1 domain-containing protein n=1 Tax=Dipteronia sinensis TaxID=43782 RepID=A0AAE0DYK5_9ROSI|nr:hypothetical protein Dsin_027018 [Dipteronia sinensis]